MLLVRTYLDASTIEGIGCFADEDIPRGTVIWRFDSTFDQVLSRSEYDALSPVARDYIDRYSFETEAASGSVVVDGDNARFFNHSRIPTVGGGEGAEDIALRDIKKGEELTEDYREYPDQTPQEWL